MGCGKKDLQGNQFLRAAQISFWLTLNKDLTMDECKKSNFGSQLVEFSSNVIRGIYPLL